MEAGPDTPEAGAARPPQNVLAATSAEARASARSGPAPLAGGRPPARQGRRRPAELRRRGARGPARAAHDNNAGCRRDAGGVPGRSPIGNPANTRLPGG